MAEWGASRLGIPEDARALGLGLAETAPSFTWHHGVRSVKGPRKHMEDKFMCIPDYSKEIRRHMMMSMSMNMSTETHEHDHEHDANNNHHHRQQQRQHQDDDDDDGGGRVEVDAMGEVVRVGRLSGAEANAADAMGFFAVYDGHSGDQAAAYLEANLHLQIARSVSAFCDDG